MSSQAIYTFYIGDDKPLLLRTWQQLIIDWATDNLPCPPMRGMRRQTRRVAGYRDRGLLLLPPHLLISIMGLLDPYSIISLRLTCKGLAFLTFENGIWSRLYAYQKATLPQPPFPHPAHSSPLTFSRMQRIVLETHRVACQWALPRPFEPMVLNLHVKPERRSTLLGIEILHDRWLVAVYGCGYICIWDLGYDGLAVEVPCEGRVQYIQIPDGVDEAGRKRPVLVRHYDAGDGGWTTFCAKMSKGEGSIDVWIVKPDPPSQVRRYTMNIINTGGIVSVVISDPGITLIAIAPKMDELLVHYDPVLMQFITYESHEHRVPRCTVDRVLKAKVLGGSLLLFNSSYFGVHRMLSHTDFSLHQLVFDGSEELMCYDVAFSEVHNGIFKAGGQLEGIHYLSRLTALAYDVAVGIYRWAIVDGMTCEISRHGFYTTVVGHPSFGRSRLNFSSLHPLSTPIAVIGSGVNARYRYPGDHVELLPLMHETRPRREDLRFNGLHAGSVSKVRTTVTTMAMGAQGMRAVWVEKNPLTGCNEVRVWEHENFMYVLGKNAGEGLAAGNHLASDQLPVMVSSLIYTTRTRNKQDDFVHCALAESTGRIALATRSGEILVL